MKSFKRIFSFILALTMVFSFAFNDVVFADREPESKEINLPENWDIINLDEQYEAIEDDDCAGYTGQIPRPNGYLEYWTRPSFDHLKELGYDYVISESCDSFGCITYGNDYQFPSPSVIFYQAGGKTIGKNKYYYDGGYCSVRIDQEKRKGGPMAAFVFVERIKPTIKNIRLSTVSAIEGKNTLNQISGGFPSFYYLGTEPDDGCQVSTVYDNVKGSLKDDFDYHWFHDKKGVIPDEEFDINNIEHWRVSFVYNSKKKSNKDNWYDHTKNSVFSDVPNNHWAKDSINKAYELNYVRGVGNNCYDPEGKLRKSQVLQMLYNFWLKDNPEDKVNLSESNNWYDEAVVWAKNNGLLLDNEIGFDLNSPASREFTCLIIGRFVENKNIGLPYFLIVSPFDDLQNKSAELQNSVKVLQKADIISGYPDGLFHPDDILTRAQAAKIIENLKYANNCVVSGQYLAQSGADYN